MSTGTARTPTPAQRAAARLALRMNTDTGRPTSPQVRAIAEQQPDRPEPGNEDR